MEKESLVTDSSCSHFDLPHIPLLLHYLATACTMAFNKARVVNRLLISRHSQRLSIRIVSAAYNVHNCVTAAITGLGEK